jgi:mannose-6-phosphate isomerase-like protein (cupin superfamily)
MVIVRNFKQNEVQQGLYQAHGGGIASMLFDRRILRGILFLAYGVLGPGKVSELHIDPYEEIYYVLEGEALMRVGDDEARVTKGDAIWIPAGDIHGMRNDGDADCVVLVVASELLP